MSKSIQTVQQNRIKFQLTKQVKREFSLCPGYHSLMLHQKYNQISLRFSDTTIKLFILSVNIHPASVPIQNTPVQISLHKPEPQNPRSEKNISSKP